MNENLKLEDYPVGCLYTSKSYEDPNTILPGTWARISPTQWTRVHAESNVQEEAERYPLKDCVLKSDKHTIPVNGSNMILVSFVVIWGHNPHFIKKPEEDNQDIFNMRGYSVFVNKILSFGKITAEALDSFKKWLDPVNVPLWTENIALKADMYLDDEHADQETHRTQLDDFVYDIPCEYTMNIIDDTNKPDQDFIMIRIDEKAELDDITQLIKAFFFAPPMTKYRLELDKDIIRRMPETDRRTAVLRFCEQYRLPQDMADELTNYMCIDKLIVKKTYEVKYADE